MDWISLVGVPVVGGLVGFAVWYFQSRIERIRTEQARLHDERRSLYSAILDPYIRVLTAVKTGEDPKKTMKYILSYEYRKAGFEFSLIAPDEVLKAYNDLMQYFFAADESGGAEPREMLRHWGAFMLAIRRNLGNPGTKLNEVDILRSWITDADKILKSPRQTSA